MEAGNIEPPATAPHAEPPQQTPVPVVPLAKYLKPKRTAYLAWTDDEEDRLLEFIKAQNELSAADMTKPNMGSGKFWQIVSTQLQSLDYDRTCSSYSSHLHFLNNAKKADTGHDGTEAEEGLTSSRPKHPLLGRDDYIDSGTLIFKSGELRKQLIKIQRKSLNPNAEFRKMEGNDFNQHAGMSPTAFQTQTSAGTDLASPSSPQMTAAQLQQLDANIQGLKVTKNGLTKSIMELDATLDNIKKLKEKQDTFAEVDQKITAMRMRRSVPWDLWRRREK